MDKPELGELKSKPAFKVEIIRGNTTLNLVCSFSGPGDDGGEYSNNYNHISFQDTMHIGWSRLFFCKTSYKLVSYLS